MRSNQSIVMLSLLSMVLVASGCAKTETTATSGGLTDAETRYRQRYVDLAVHADVREVFMLRATVVRLIRQFFDTRGFVEVETPILQPIYGGAAATPFVTDHKALGTRLYLRIADELYLKRCIVGGLDRVYEIGHDFRNEDRHVYLSKNLTSHPDYQRLRRQRQ